MRWPRAIEIRRNIGVYTNWRKNIIISSEFTIQVVCCGRYEIRFDVNK